MPNWVDAETHPVTTVVASTLDQRADLIENGQVLAEGKLSIDGQAGALGSHVLILKGSHGGARGLSWHGISHQDRPGGRFAGAASDDDIVSRLHADGAFRRAVQRRMHPGMVMIVTDLSLHPDRRSDTDFVIMSSV